MIRKYQRRALLRTRKALRRYHRRRHYQHRVIETNLMGVR